MQHKPTLLAAPHGGSWHVMQHALRHAAAIHSTASTLCAPQVLAVLGGVAGKRVLELGAGIGRFTGDLARNAAHVTACDFMAASIAENERLNAHYGCVRDGSLRVMVECVCWLWMCTLGAVVQR